MKPDEIRTLVRQLDTHLDSEAERIWERLQPLGKEVVPYLAEHYAQAQKWQGRRSLIFHSIRYAKDSEDAYQLGLAAIDDKATLVRYRACQLLARAQRSDAIPHLEKLLSHPDKETVSDANAAIDAIRSRNYNYFKHRQHTGRLWIVGGGNNPFITKRDVLIGILVTLIVTFVIWLATRR